MPKKNSVKKPVLPAAKKSTKSKAPKADPLQIKSSRESNVVSKSSVFLPNVFRLSLNSQKVIYKNWKPFTIISGLYFFLTLLFVRGFSSTVNVQQLKNYYFSGAHKPSVLSSSLSVMLNLIDNNSSASVTSTTSSSNSIYQSILFVVFSLVFIWMIRETVKNNRVTTKNSLYKSQSSLIPFLIVLFYLILESIPLIIGIFLYGTVFGSGIAVHAGEKVVWFIVCVAFILLSLYLLSSSLFAIFIVTLPETRPIQALRSAWRLVKGRRILILRKILFLPIALIIAIGVISIVFVLLIPQIADFVFFALGVISLPVVLSYLYTLYREVI